MQCQARTHLAIGTRLLEDPEICHVSSCFMHVHFFWALRQVGGWRHSCPPCMKEGSWYLPCAGLFLVVAHPSCLVLSLTMQPFTDTHTQTHTHFTAALLKQKKAICKREYPTGHRLFLRAPPTKSIWIDAAGRWGNACRTPATEKTPRQ